MGGAGLRCWKKRMPSCNGADTGSQFARPEREQTSGGCPFTRTLEDTTFREESSRTRPLGGVCTSRPLRGIVAACYYRKVDVEYNSHQRVAPQGHIFGMLEPCDGKLSCRVLRGERG